MINKTLEKDWISEVFCQILQSQCEDALYTASTTSHKLGSITAPLVLGVFETRLYVNSCQVVLFGKLKF